MTKYDFKQHRLKTQIQTDKSKDSAMAEIVVVHGIDQQQKSADVLENDWLPALAGGVRVAGFPDIADRIWRDRGKPGSIETRMAFYGSLFRTPGQQGDDPGEFTPEEAEFAKPWPWSGCATPPGGPRKRRPLEPEGKLLGL